MVYSKEELWEIQNRTRLVSSDPYKLFVAFTLAALKECCDSDDGNFNVLGANISSDIAKTILNGCIEDFIDAIDNGNMIEIGETSYSIRNKRFIKKDLLSKVFNFDFSGDNVLVDQNSINNVSNNNSIAKESNDRNMIYFQKIVMLADSSDDGYDKLTDMEAAVYCWGLFHSKNIISETGPCMYHEFYEKYKDYFGLDMFDVLGCVIDGLRFPYHYWSFSADKIKAWNIKNKQKSIVDDIDAAEATNFWYEVALQKRFKEK